MGEEPFQLASVQGLSSPPPMAHHLHANRSEGNKLKTTVSNY